MKTFWGKDRNGRSHHVHYPDGKPEPSCGIHNEAIVAIRFTDDPDDPCPTCKYGRIILPKATPVLVDEHANPK